MDAAVLSSVRETAGDLLSTFLHEFDRSQLTISMLQPLATTVAAGRNGSKISHIVDALVDLEDDIRVPCLMGLADGLSRNKQPIKTPPDGWLSVKRLLTNSAHPVKRLLYRAIQRRITGLSDNLITEHPAIAPDGDGYLGNT